MNKLFFFKITFALLLAIGNSFLSSVAAQDEGQTFPQKPNFSFSLSDLDGKTVSLEAQTDSAEADHKLTVVCFLGTECPLAKLYASRLNQYQTEFPDVRFVGVFSNQQDSNDDIRAFANKFKVKFPIVRDTKNVIADQFNAERTPEVFLVDQSLELQYRGRIDDQYQPGTAKPEPQRHDLKLAMESCLTGKPVELAQTEPEGCLIGRIRNAENANHDITYANQISRLLQNHCSECHRDGEIGPMQLSDYDEVVGWAEMVVEVVNENRMPPWHADPDHGEFTNERRMTIAEKQMLQDWLNAGTPKGNLEDLPAPRKIADAGKWQLPKKPDVVVAMRDRPFIVPAEGTVEYQYFVVDPEFKEDKWIVAAEILPGDRSVLHHSIVFVRPPDGTPIYGIGWLAAYVPGQSAPTFNPKFGRMIPAGSKLVFQQHYTPTGKQTSDTTRIGLVLGDEKTIEHEVSTLIALDQDFMIPPGASNHSVSARFNNIPKQGTLMGISPHMHFRGKSFELTAKFSAAGTDSGSDKLKTETLLRVPEYDFNWQHIYQLKNPMPLADVESLEFVAAFDNSADNPANPDPTRHVTWGDQTWEEMAVAFIMVSQPRNADSDLTPRWTLEQLKELELAEQKVHDQAEKYADEYFLKFDVDKDGKIPFKDLPRSVRDFGRWQIDTDSDGFVTRSEIAAGAKNSFSYKASRAPKGR